MLTRLLNVSTVLGLALGLCLPASGCGGSSSRITKANADKITAGMSEKEVADILGLPNESTEKQLGLQNLLTLLKQSVWKEGDKIISLTFVNGVVETKTATGF